MVPKNQLKLSKVSDFKGAITAWCQYCDQATGWKTEE